MSATKAGSIIIARGTSNAAFTQLTGCSVTRSSTTATLTKTSHGRSNGDKVLIQGFANEEYNGIFTVANAAANTFDYTIKQDPGANPSGTTGTVDLVTLGTKVDLSTAYGMTVVVGVQNGNTGPTAGFGAQVWIGTATADNEVDYLWRQVQTADATANVLSFWEFFFSNTLYVNVAICRNAGQPVDCYAIGAATTGI